MNWLIIAILSVGIYAQQGYVGIVGMNPVFDAVIKNKYGLGYDSTFIRNDTFFVDTSGLKTYKSSGLEDTSRAFPMRDKDRQSVGIYGICQWSVNTAQTNVDSLQWTSKFDCKYKDVWFPSGQYTTFDTTQVDSVLYIRKSKTCHEPAWPIVCDSMRIRRSATASTSNAKFYPVAAVKVK